MQYSMVGSLYSWCVLKFHRYYVPWYHSCREVSTDPVRASARNSQTTPCDLFLFQRHFGGLFEINRTDPMDVCVPNDIVRSLKVPTASCGLLNTSNRVRNVYRRVLPVSSICSPPSRVTGLERTSGSQVSSVIGKCTDPIVSTRMSNNLVLCISTLYMYIRCPCRSRVWHFSIYRYAYVPPLGRYLFLIVYVRVGYQSYATKFFRPCMNSRVMHLKSWCTWTLWSCINSCDLCIRLCMALMST